MFVQIKINYYISYLPYFVISLKQFTLILANIVLCCLEFAVNVCENSFFSDNFFFSLHEHTHKGEVSGCSTCTVFNRTLSQSYNNIHWHTKLLSYVGKLITFINFTPKSRVISNMLFSVHFMILNRGVQSFYVVGPKLLHARVCRKRESFYIYFHKRLLKTFNVFFEYKYICMIFLL